MTYSTWGADATSANAHHLPPATPVIWPYVTGTPDIRWSDTLMGAFEHSARIRVDQGFDSMGPFDADEFDVEPGADSVARAVSIVEARRMREWSTRLYADRTVHEQLVVELSHARIHSSVFFRLADWDLDEHDAKAELQGNVYAIQWASPTSNPDTFVPGTTTRLAEAQVDLNVVALVGTGWEG